MKHVAALALVLVVCLAFASWATAVCVLPGFAQLPYGTPISLGPVVYYYASNFADVGNAFVGAHDA